MYVVKIGGICGTLAFMKPLFLFEELWQSPKISRYCKRHWLDVFL